MSGAQKGTSQIKTNIFTNEFACFKVSSLSGAGESAFLLFLHYFYSQFRFAEIDAYKGIKIG